MNDDNICKTCACFTPTNIRKDIVGVCSVGHYYLPIYTHEKIAACCLYEDYGSKSDAKEDKDEC